jgi:hypothetical protein
MGNTDLNRFDHGPGLEFEALSPALRLGLDGSPESAPRCGELDWAE